MDSNLRWSPEAIEDLESIAEYIERDSGFYAKAVVTKVMDTVNSISNNPGIGRIVPELTNEDMRERFVYSYRLIYRVRKSDVLIVAIIHGRRLLEGVVDRFE